MPDADRSSAAEIRSSAPWWRALVRPRFQRIAALGGAFAIGVLGAALLLQGRPPVVLALMPAPIATLQDWRPAAVKGQVAEIFGNKFIIQDDSGRALVDTGPEGDRSNLVKKSEVVTVQGRFENGFLHAQAISHADGRADLLGPPGPPPPGNPLAWLNLRRPGA